MPQENPMSVVSNYTSLSPAMRAALTGRVDIERTNVTLAPRQATVDALVARGMAEDHGNRWYSLTEAGERARVALVKADETPLKIQPWLDKASKLGLEVHESERSGSLRSWTVSTPNPIDNTQVWIYWTDSARGGRIGFTVYHGSSVRPTRKATRRYVSIAIADMGESLQRHLDREAQKDAGLEAELAELDPSNPVPAGWDHDETRSTVARHQADPARPGWFMVGQHIFDRVACDNHQVTAVELGRDGKVARVAVSLNGGHGGKWYWFGDHPDAIGGLDHLEGDHVGLSDEHRRAWPSLRAAQAGIARVLVDQVLSGWAAGQVREKPEDGNYVVVNIPDGTDSTRHLELLRRYVPYRANVKLQSSTQYDRYPTIVITPRED